MRSTNTSTLLTLFLGFLLLCSSVFGSTVSARSARARDAALRRTPSTPASFALDKRALTPPVPSVQDCKAKLMVQPNKAVFYVSAVQNSANKYAEENGMVTIWTAGLSAYEDELDQLIDKAEADGLETWDTGDYTDFWTNASRAFALLASGAVTAIVPAGNNLPEGSFWTTIEYPILTDSTQNSHVTSISVLAGTDQAVAPTGQPTRLWP